MVMTITSWGFIAFVSIAALVFNIAPGRWRAGFVFPVTTLVFLGLVLPTSQAVVALLGFISLLWLATEVTFRWPRRHVQLIALFLVLVIFGWMKSYDFLAFLPLATQVPATIGLSYILIRALQLLIDLSEAPELRPAPLTLFSFLASWPCLVSGPIQRFQDFRDQMASMDSFSLTEDVLVTAVQRIIKGFFYVLVLADAAKHLWLGLKGISFEQPRPIALAGAQGAFLIHLFFDFAGYTEIVIGVGYLFGLRLPENFNRPFLAKSFLEFWGRWHMTLSNWFKIYIFNPVLMALTKHWPSPSTAIIHGCVAFFLTFFLVGLWHGTTWVFVLCGLLVGIGASVNQLYRSLLRKWLGKKRFDSLAVKQPYIAVVAALTFTYLCLCVSTLWMNLTQILQVARNYSVSGLIVAEFALFLMWLLVVPLIHWRPLVASRPLGRWGKLFFMGFQCAVIDAYTFLFPAFGGAFFYEQF
jgi:alginate O-acetyltransferase complex protein AlgI